MTDSLLVYYESSDSVRGGWRLVFPQKLHMTLCYTKRAWKYLDVVD